jgi:hypothetical protein
MKEDERVGHAVHMGEMKNAYKIFIGKPRRRWEDNIRMTDRKCVDWVV